MEPLSRAQIFSGARPNVGRGECFATASLNATAACARCVHFVTMVVVLDRWGSAVRLIRGLTVTIAGLRASQRCFTLSAYTNARAGSSAWASLALLEDASVFVRRLPDDLPRNAYSGARPWLELSRRKLDLLERYERRFRRKAIWTDLDTIVDTDLACAYARAPNFVVSRWRHLRTLRGPQGRTVWLENARSVFGDLFMLDKALIAKVRGLERSGMPPPALDLQDYLSFLLNRCDGSVVDLRALVREDGFAHGEGACFGFDFAQGQHPNPAWAKLKIVKGKLHCGIMGDGGNVHYHPVAALSFTAFTFWRMLDAPREYFKTPALERWAERRSLLRVT